MKFIIENSKKSAAHFFRRAGYVFQKHEGDEMAFVRRLADQSFPRFHLFVKVEGNKFRVNLHLDHKAASYKGTKVHSGEYGKDSQLLHKEIERLKSLGEEK
jgi:hypothetical protein